MNAVSLSNLKNSLSGFKGMLLSVNYYVVLTLHIRIPSFNKLFSKKPNILAKIFPNTISVSNTQGNIYITTRRNSFYKNYL